MKKIIEQSRAYGTVPRLQGGLCCANDKAVDDFSYSIKKYAQIIIKFERIFSFLTYQVAFLRIGKFTFQSHKRARRKRF